MSIKNILLTITALLLVAVAILIFYFQSQLGSAPISNSNTDVDIDNSLVQADSFAINGQYENATRIYDQLIQNSTGLFNTQYYEILKAYTLFFSGNQNNGNTAIGMVNNIIINPETSSGMRAWSYVALLNFYYTSPANDVLQSIRNLPIFSNVRDLPDPQFLKYLAQISNDTLPTSFGTTYLALPDAKALALGQYENEAEKNSLADSIIQRVATASLLQEAESDLPPPPYHSMWLAHLHGLLLGDAVMYGGQAVDYSHKFKEVLALSQANPNNPPMQNLMPVSQFFLAAFDQGTTGDETVANDLVAYLQSADTDQTIKSNFASFIKKNYLSDSPSMTKQLIESLRLASPDFKRLTDTYLAQ